MSMPSPSHSSGSTERIASRRQFLSSAGAGFGSLALASLLADDRLLAAESPEHSDASAERRADDGPLNPLASRPPHFPPRVKSVIFLFMYGGPSQVDTFDPKPALDKWHGKAIPVFKKEDAFNARTKATAMRSPFKFAQHGESGIPVCDRFPQVARCVDDICVIRSMYASSNNHGPALFQMNTGFVQAGRPSIGSWVTYGLGSESQNLPGYVVLMDKRGAPVNGALNWTNGFMPATYQGVPFRGSGEPIANLGLPAGISPQQQRRRLDLIRRFDEQYLAENPAEQELAARIASYELAWRMQSSAPDAVDLAQETAATHTMYGLDQGATAHFGRNCLLARRLVERGVRFVQVYSGGDNGLTAWDAHDNVEKNHTERAAETDQPVAALLQDLKARGLLDTTLVIWGTEFGRLPTNESSVGRDHNPFGFTIWLAGGGIRGGMTLGATDEFGYAAVENRVSVPDLHATILHMLGLDHKRLTYPFLGRDVRLTDVSGRVVTEVLT